VRILHVIVGVARRGAAKWGHVSRKVGELAYPLPSTVIATEWQNLVDHAPL
jgi:hypothetical protein